MSIEYAIIVERFAERHFINGFSRKYKGAWDITWKGILEQFSGFDELFKTSIAETIAHDQNVKICKVEFRVYGTQESRHGSGNRCIVAVHKDTNKVCVLLVYGKTDLSGHNETLEWKKLIAENYPEYKEYCK
ncbi:MAG: hypothetical protein NT077_02870 [Candidatus Taylorbacteria bacterium]|nr:hypothetical protein [Candidatus Taylorbacteria bacterium]